MKNFNKSLLGASIFLATSLYAISSMAAALEEVIVTAQKREQSVQDIGIAISAFTGDQLEQLGYSNAQQITALAPGVSTIQPNGEANYAIGIRGVANSDFTTNVESPVSIYVDEVYISQMSGSGFMLFDMERVEILRGPQGTLFGRNATGGLAHFVTRKPTQDFNGFGEFTFGEHEQIKFKGAVGGGLTDTLAGRLSVATHHNKGYIKNRLDPDNNLNNANDYAGRAQLLFTPTDDLEILLNGRYSKQNIRTGFFEYVSSVVEGQLTPGVPNPILGGYTDNDGDPYAGSYDSPGHNDLETYGVSGTIKWNIGNFKLTSITDFSSVERDYIEDSDASPVNLFNFYLTTDAEQFSQELRLNGETDVLKWVAGIYYLNISLADSNGAETEPFVDPTSATPYISGLDNPYTTETESWSLFGQIEHAFNEQWSGILGFRWIEENKQHSYAINAVDFIPGSTLRGGNPNILAQIATYQGERDDGVWSAKAEVDWRPNNDLLLYVSWNRGVKGGGFNSPIFPVSPPQAYDDATFNYKPEKLDAYEVGFKSTILGGIARVNGSAYYYDYNDYQAFQIILLDTITKNADAKSHGFELEIQATPTDGLDLLFGIAYNDIDVDLGNGEPEVTSVQSPKWNLNGLARYEWPLFNGRMAIQSDFQYRSKHFFSLNQIEGTTEDGYTVVNAALNYTTGDDRWMASIFVNNLTDEEYLVQTFDLSGPNIFGMTEQYYGRPRWVGGSIKYRW